MRTADQTGHIRRVRRVDFRGSPEGLHGLPASMTDEYGLVMVELPDGSRQTWATTDLGWWELLVGSSWLSEPEPIPVDVFDRLFPFRCRGWMGEWVGGPVDWTDRSLL